ncbi:MAG TPA: hypothetical protein VI485_21735 [Vicinamibacterales bacterium]|nr:hypothetical protein [Vicinamibacterales bacterium]
MIDEITQAVLSREEIARYLQGSTGECSRAARERIEAYLLDHLLESPSRRTH